MNLNKHYLCCNKLNITVLLCAFSNEGKFQYIKQITPTKNALYLTRFHVIWNPFENHDGIPTDPWGFIIVPIPIPHPYPWESPYPRQPCTIIAQ